MERLLTLLLQVVKQVTRWIPGLPSSRRPKAVAYYPGMSRRKRGRATQKGPAQPKRSSKGHEADPPGDLAGGTAEMTQYDADQSSSSEPHTVPDPVPDQPVQVEPTPDATCQWSAGECTVSPLVAATPANPQPPGEPSEPTLAKSERLQILPPPSGDFDVLGVHDRSATDLDDPAPESAGAAPTAPEKPPAGLSFAAGALSAKRPQDNDRTAENPVPTALKARGSHPQPGLSLVVQAENQTLSRDVVSEPRAFPPAPIRGGHGGGAETKSAAGPNPRASAPPQLSKADIGPVATRDRGVSWHVPGRHPRLTRQPIARGGRHRVAEPGTRLQGSQGRKRLDVMCQRWGMGWRIVADQERFGEDDHVTQSGQKLERTPGGQWVLRDLFAPLVIGSRPFTLAETLYPSCRIFRLGIDSGRAVMAPSGRGDYLIVLPTTWRLSRTQGSTRPQQIGITGWNGFEVSWGEGIKIVDDAGHSFAPWENPQVVPELSGQTVEVFAGMAPLFIKDAPQVAAHWEHVSQVILGLEDHAGEPWRHAIVVRHGRWPGMPPLPRRLGWYYLRFYDKLGNLLDSRSFFYAADLHHVAWETENGETRVLFRHNAHLRVEAASDTLGVMRDDQGQETRIVIPLGPNWDVTRWHLKDQAEDSRILFPLRLKRLAWTVAPSSVPDGAATWDTKPIRVPKNTAKPTSRWTLYISAPESANGVIQFSTGLSVEKIRPDQDGRASIPLYRWSAQVRDAEQTPLSMRIRERSWMVLQWVTEYRCRRCDDRFEDRSRLWDHVRGKHPIAFQPVTQFEEYKQRADELQLAISLPTRVYRCDYCHKLVRDDQVFGNSMNQPMQSHQEREHRIPGGTTRIAFTVLKTIAEVQAVITDSLPAIAVCQACSAPVLSANPQDRDDHAETHYREMMIAE